MPPLPWPGEMVVMQRGRTDVVLTSQSCAHAYATGAEVVARRTHSLSCREGRFGRSSISDALISDSTPAVRPPDFLGHVTLRENVAHAACWIGQRPRVSFRHLFVLHGRGQLVAMFFSCELDRPLQPTPMFLRSPCKVYMLCLPQFC